MKPRRLALGLGVFVTAGALGAQPRPQTAPNAPPPSTAGETPPQSLPGASINAAPGRVRTGVLGRAPRPQEVSSQLPAGPPPIVLQSTAPAASATPNPTERAGLAAEGAPAGLAQLSLPVLLTAVSDRYPLLIAAQRDREAADGELLAAEGAFDPQWRSRAAVSPFGYYQPLTLDTQLTQPTQLWGMSFFAGYRLGTGLTYTGIPIYDGKYETNNFGELRAGLSVPLWRNGPIDRNRASLRRAELARAMAGLTLVQQRLEIQRLATVRYWEWVASGRRLAIVESLLRLAVDRNQGIVTRVTRGDLPQFEATDNQRAIVQRRGAVVSARRAIEQAAIELGLYFRASDGSPSELNLEQMPEALPEPSPLASRCVLRRLDDAATRRPEARRLELARERERIERDYQDNQRRPAIDVVVAASQDLGPGSPSREPFVLETGVVIDIPLLNRVPTGRMQVAEAAMARVGEQARFARDRIAADVRDALSALRAAEDRLRVARDELTLARELARQERARFDLGDGTLLVVNLREQAASEAELREVDALVEWQRALAAWRYAIGHEGPGDGCAE
ncbi:MAG: TolC family protein [Myxococcales bacterium]|nr:TolC family protein [Myxococcales bacterium]